LCCCFKHYLATNLNETVLVLVVVDFEVTTTVAVQSTPDINPVIVILLSGVALELEVLKIDELSASLITVTATVIPAVGKIELTFTLITCDDPTTDKIFPAPGSIFTENATADSIGIGVGVCAGAGVELSLPLLQEKSKKGNRSNNNFIDFINYSFTILN
jgi:hypothetical protein